MNVSEYMRLIPLFFVTLKCSFPFLVLYFFFNKKKKNVNVNIAGFVLGMEYLEKYGIKL